MRVKIFFATVRAVNNGRYSLILVSDHRGNWGEDFEANLKSCNDSPLYCICKHRHTSTHVLTGTWKIMGADRVRLSDIFCNVQEIFNDLWSFDPRGGLPVHPCKSFYGGDTELNEKNCNDNNFFMGSLLRQFYDVLVV